MKPGTEGIHGELFGRRENRRNILNMNINSSMRMPGITGTRKKFIEKAGKQEIKFKQKMRAIFCPAWRLI